MLSIFNDPQSGWLTSMNIPGPAKNAKIINSIVTFGTAQGGPYGRACCRKALVLCPASLVKNWAGETKLQLTVPAEFGGRDRFVSLDEIYHGIYYMVI